MAAGLRVLVLATLLAVAVMPADSKIHLRPLPSFGCTNGRKDGLFRHKDVSACNGAWRGHVENAQLCGSGWHICSWNDTKLLSTVTWYEATHIDGCYAINAAHGNRNCGPCSVDNDELAAVGADCPIQSSEQPSCFGIGKLDADCCSEGNPLKACAYKPWMSGVVCCRDRVQGFPPKFTESPKSRNRVDVGSQVSLTCTATGNPLPTVTWYRNGYPLAPRDGTEIDVTVDDGAVTSRFSISSAQPQDEGLYLCRALNRHGYGMSYTSDVTVLKPMPNLVGCKKKEGQHVLHGGDLVACVGKWRGQVKRASKRMCATGWHVCGLRDMKVLNQLLWSEVTSLDGCYAYDAATSDNFACTKCSRRNKGNRMSGIGSGCGDVDRAQASCLNKGRIGVFPLKSNGNFTEDEFDIGNKPRVSSKTRGSCKYKRGFTSGVMCCKNRRRKGKKCKSPCTANSHCNRHGVCKCDKGFKQLGKVCILRKRSNKRRGRCSKIQCLNNGRCRRGKCICPPRFTGARCETAASLPFTDIH